MRMLKVTLNDQIRQCDHCGAKNIKRTFCIRINKEIYYIGRICVERMTDVNTSGNPHRAASRVESYLKTLEPDDIYNLILGEANE